MHQIEQKRVSADKPKSPYKEEIGRKVRQQRPLFTVDKPSENDSEQEPAHVRQNGEIIARIERFGAQTEDIQQIANIKRACRSSDPEGEEPVADPEHCCTENGKKKSRELFEKRIDDHAGANQMQHTELNDILAPNRTHGDHQHRNEGDEHSAAKYDQAAAEAAGAERCAQTGDNDEHGTAILKQSFKKCADLPLPAECIVHIIDQMCSKDEKQTQATKRINLPNTLLFYTIHKNNSFCAYYTGKAKKRKLFSCEVFFFTFFSDCGKIYIQKERNDPMNQDFHAPEDTALLIDDVKRIIGQEAEQTGEAVLEHPLPQMDETMVYRPAKERETFAVKEPADEAFELDIHYEENEMLPEMPQQEDALPERRPIKAYNTDYVKPPREAEPRPVAPPQTYVPQRVETKKQKRAKRSKAMQTDYPEQKHRKKHPILLTLLVLVLVLAIVCVCMWFFFPKRPDATQMKKGDVATILIAGTDRDGTRTDTMMLLYIDRDAQKVSLLSLPRDLLTYVDGNAMKLNAVYGYGGCGKAGMQTLMNEMSDRIGFRPDGYILVDFDAVEDIVDDMGGIDFDVPCDMNYNDPAQDLSIQLKQGQQHLSGEQALWVLRYRSGYALADLKRVEVQRDLVKAAIDQWSSGWKLPQGVWALFTLEDGTTTDLSSRNLAWIAKALWSIGVSDMHMATLPGEWNSPYYYPYAQTGADLLNESFNPTTRTITAEDVGY